MIQWLRHCCFAVPSCHTTVRYIVIQWDILMGLPSGKLTVCELERSTIFHGKIHYKWWCSIQSYVKLPEGKPLKNWDSNGIWMGISCDFLGLYWLYVMNFWELHWGIMLVYCRRISINEILGAFGETWIVCFSTYKCGGCNLEHPREWLLVVHWVHWFQLGHKSWLFVHGNVFPQSLGKYMANIWLLNMLTIY